MDLSGLISDYKNKIANIANYKNKLLSIAVIIFALLIANNIYKGQAKNLALLRERKDTETKKVEVLENISRIKKDVFALTHTINKKDTSAIINKLSSIARDAAVKIEALRPQAEKDYPDYVKYSFELTLEADNYHAIAKFISGLESSPDIYMVESISISKQQQERAAEKTDALTADLKLSTILIKD